MSRSLKKGPYVDLRLLAKVDKQVTDTEGTVSGAALQFR